MIEGFRLERSGCAFSKKNGNLVDYDKQGERDQRKLLGQLFGKKKTTSRRSSCCGKKKGNTTKIKRLLGRRATLPFDAGKLWKPSTYRGKVAGAPQKEKNKT